MNGTHAPPPGLLLRLAGALTVVALASCDIASRPSVTPPSDSSSTDPARPGAPPVVDARVGSTAPAEGAMDESPVDVLQEGLAQADGWARDGHPPNDERVQPPSRGRRCYRCRRAWFRAAAEQPVAFSQALSERNDTQVASVTASNVFAEYGNVAALAFVRALDGSEPLWQAAAGGLVETESFLRWSSGLLLHEVRRHAAASPQDEGRRVRALLLLARMSGRACEPQGDGSCRRTIDWDRPESLLGRPLAAEDGVHVLEQPMGWRFADTMCPAFGGSPAFSSRLLLATREHAESHAPDLRAGALSVLSCLCSRRAVGAKRELGAYFRQRVVNPTSLDAELAVAFEGSCP